MLGIIIAQQKNILYSSTMKQKIVILFLIIMSLFPSKRVGLIPINGEINAALQTKVKFSLDYFEKEKFDMVIVKIDTPGGEVFSAIKIARALQEAKVPVVGYIDGWAISAGALITYACPTVYAKKGSIMGAATPVHTSSSAQMVEAPEKINSALRAQFRSTARVSNRDEALAEAMVDKEICLVERNGTIISLGSKQKVLESDQVVCAAGKLLTLSDAELLKYGVVDVLLATPLLEHPDFKDFEGCRPEEFKNKKMHFFTLLQKPLVSSILSLAMMAGFYSLFSTGNFGFSFFSAIACGSLLLVSQHSAETFAVLEWILLGIGLFCLLAESFIPGFGVLGLLGIVLVLASLFVMNVVPSVSWHLPSFGFSKTVVAERSIAFCAAISAFCAILLTFSKSIVKRIFKTSPLILRDDVKQEVAQEKFKKGDQGLCRSALKPWGKIEVCGKLVSVKSEKGYIKEGKEVKITSIKNSTYLVREV
jgi:membrane-bound serine protease (ClpP class)